MAMLVGSVAVALASPIASPGPPKPKDDNEDVGMNVAKVGRCPTDCWNEAAAKAGCDPNTSDDCLCGPFFNAVTYCTAQTCNAGDNLAAKSEGSIGEAHEDVRWKYRYPEHINESPYHTRMYLRSTVIEPAPYWKASLAHIVSGVEYRRCLGTSAAAGQMWPDAVAQRPDTKVRLAGGLGVRRENSSGRS
ncbi:hypothetical protein BU25DRAFT_422636 [Macroventuria anomochaeta]|uniref:Uncharacterized protein n=1 Tax=Macroventuria anomochaeta TaxID=301207 RepID=A0ACB6RX36_9PLEO|nr:uncharacterized protein BU25DRAFT_422636 [Macroventuria anomochaeta]KAF2626486.1 hypothetical protein BU25DRAFT_422636 [Macroventuria anomochaeta]